MRGFRAASTIEAAITFFGRHTNVQFEHFDQDRVVFSRYQMGEKFIGAQFRGTKIAPVWHYHFRTEQGRENYIANAKADIERAAAHHAERAEREKAANEAFVQPFKVGEILNTSWGYDQTNVEFFEVVGVFGKRGVLLRELAQETIPGSEGYMCENVKPRPGLYLRDWHHDEQTNEIVYTEREPLRKMVSNDGTVNIHNAKFGHARLWDGMPHYQSHYA